MGILTTDLPSTEDANLDQAKKEHVPPPEFKPRKLWWPFTLVIDSDEFEQGQITAYEKRKKTQQTVYDQAEEVKLSYPNYMFLRQRCFDACIHNFDNKRVDLNEKKCLDECVSNLKEVPIFFKKTH